MRRGFFALYLLLMVTLACQGLVPAAPTPTLTSPPPTATVTASPTPIATTPPTLTPPPIELSDPADFDVRFHPDGGLYVGDLVSMEVIAPLDAEIDGNVSVQVVNGEGEILGESTFAPFGIGGRQQATLEWMWDTAGLEAGAHDLSLALLPGDVTWTETIVLLPQEQLGLPESESQWAIEESDCCLLYYLAGTATERDIQALGESADEQAQDVADKFGIDFEEPIEITLMSRVIGHGGFAAGEIYISYLDRNYTGSDFDLVLHHEMVHILDSRLGGNLRPSMLAEGLAVYLTGGHFKPEPLMPRAAALLDLMVPDSSSDWYLPLEMLADSFYKSQHEIGYLQAGALVEYMVETWGWDAFSSFYRDIHHPHGGKHSTAIDDALVIHFGVTFAELELLFREALLEQNVTQDYRDDVRLTVYFYNTARRYQNAMDTSAYFLTAWLPDGPTMRQYGVVADFLRHPSSPEHITLEALLVSADGYLQIGRYREAAGTIRAVNWVLDAMDEGVAEPFLAHPVAASYYQIAKVMIEQGYKLQQVQDQGESVLVLVNEFGSELIPIQLDWVEGQWQMEQGQ
ncbi:MAG: hypothetical protein ISR58_05665 [Anaerolineales bacterium]|nr:hypothetical protein [Chloroflexota bacterium]MBL6980663.1 hypothetical protein [Anaerolineales bacterium]